MTLGTVPVYDVILLLPLVSEVLPFTMSSSRRSVRGMGQAANAEAIKKHEITVIDIMLFVKERIDIDVKKLGVRPTFELYKYHPTSQLKQKIPDFSFYRRDFSWVQYLHDKSRILQ